MYLPFCSPLHDSCTCIVEMKQNFADTEAYIGVIKQGIGDAELYHELTRDIYNGLYVLPTWMRKPQSDVQNCRRVTLSEKGPGSWLPGRGPKGRSPFGDFFRPHIAHRS